MLKPSCRSGAAVRLLWRPALNSLDPALLAAGEAGVCCAAGSSTCFMALVSGGI